MLAHVPIAILIMLSGWGLGRLLGAAMRPALWLGWFTAACACVMREVTQQEYRWIEAFGHGRRANMPVLEGLKVWEWNAHSQAETLAALLVPALLAWLMSMRR